MLLLLAGWFAALWHSRPRLWSALLRLHREERGGLGDWLPPNPFDPNTWKGLTSKIGGAVEGLINLLESVVSVFPALLNALATMAETIGTLTANAGSTVFDAISSAVSLIWGAVVNFAAGLFERIEGFASLLWGVIANAASGLFDIIASGASLIWGVLANAFSGLFERIEGLASLLWGVIANFAQGLIDVVLTVGTYIGGVLASGFAVVGDRILPIADSVADAGKKLDDIPIKITKEMLEQLFGPLDTYSDFFEALGEGLNAMATGNINSLDDWMQNIFTRNEHPSPLIFLLRVPAMLAAYQAAASGIGAVAVEKALQDFRRANPSSLLDPQDLRDAFLREELGLAEVLEQLQKAGFDARNASILTRLWEELPPPADLIRMAVREAFNPGAIALFGLDQEFPGPFAEAALKQGITNEWAQKYWIAHWALPSAQQGFDMFHRGEITGELLDALLKALDISPNWRGPLRAIAFNTVTRVDTRRLFQDGIWDRARVEREYLNLGYRPEDARDLTDWTVREFSDTAVGSKDLTRAAIEKAFKQGTITRTEAILRIIDLGYDPDEAQFFLAIVDADLADQLATEAANSIRDLTQTTVLKAYRERLLGAGTATTMLADLGYTPDGISLLLALQDLAEEGELTTLRTNVLQQEFRRGNITVDQARSLLENIGLNADRAALLARRWELQFAEKTRELTQAQLARAFRDGLIDDATYVLRLSAMGYSLEDAAVLLAFEGGGDADAVRQISASAIINAYKRDVMSRDAALARLVALGFSDEDAQTLVATADVDLARLADEQRRRDEAAVRAEIRELSQTNIAGAYKRGVITRVDAKARLLELGYRETDAELILANVDADRAATEPAL